MKSLDPRVNRLNLPESGWTDEFQKPELDQLDTYEVFVQPVEKRAYQHEGIVHASDEEMAFVFAKEQYSRRFTCSGIMIAKTSNVYVSDFSEDQRSVYQDVEEVASDGNMTDWEVFHLLRRGKQHKHMGAVMASTPEEALYQAKLQFQGDKPVYNVWVIKKEDILINEEEDKMIWDTLPEKQFRDAIAYKAGDKIQKFKEEQAQQS